MTEEKLDSFKTQEIFKQPKVLVADSDQKFLDWTESVGGSLLCKFITCTDSSSLLLQASKSKLSALLLGVDLDKDPAKIIALARKIRAVPNCRHLPIAFVAQNAAEADKISETQMDLCLYLTKPLSINSLANALSTLMSESFERYRALIVSESPQTTAKLASNLEQHCVRSKFTLRPQRTVEYLYDFEPDVVLVDTEIFSVNATELCSNLKASSRWDNLSLVLFSSKCNKIDDSEITAAHANSKLDFALAPEVFCFEVKDIAKTVRAKAETANRDFLTGLGLKDRLYERFIPQLSNPDEITTNLSLALIDVARLKTINDRYGHTTGDRVLITLTSFLLQRFDDPSNLVCRWDGDKFIVALKSAAKEADSAIENALLDFTLLKIPPVDKPVRLHAGMSHFPGDGKSVDELIDIANWRLHTAKRDSRILCAT